MSQLFTIGRLISGPVLKWSEKSKRHYVYFTLVEGSGYLETQQCRHIQVWAWGTDAERLVQAGLDKYTRIWVAGSAELVDYVNGDGIKTKGPKLCLTDWGFASEKNSKYPFSESVPMPEPIHHHLPPVTVIRGDQDILPE